MPFKYTPSRKLLPAWGALAAALLLVAGVSVFEPAPFASAARPPVEQLRLEVLERYPHDELAFTQGLELHDGYLYESTGLYGRSDIRIVVPETGEVVRSLALPARYFAEGLTVVGDALWQLTWHEETAFRRDLETLEEVGRASYAGEGWGLCFDDTRDALIMSDGTARLTFRDPETFERRSIVPVTLDGEPQDMINELECVDGEVWANVWLTETIVRIDPGSGRITAIVDASGLLTPSERAGADVLNGIAFVPEDGTFIITGKLWPWAFRVRFVPQAD